MAGKGIDFYDGAMDLGGASYSTNGTEPSMSSGGPIDVPDGIDTGRSVSMPSRPANAVDSPSEGKGKPISGPMDE